LEVKMDAYGIKLYDDFAHHPTAMEKTVTAIKLRDKQARVLVIVEFASFSMRTGVHGTRPIEALHAADGVYVLNRDTSYSSSTYPKMWQVFTSTEALVEAVGEETKAGDSLLVMSNRSLEAVHQGLQTYFNKRFFR